MGAKEKDKSLLEVAIELLESKDTPQRIETIIKEVMELKGVKASLAKELAPQFVLDFMQSGYFVYCGDDKWDLKDRQPTAVLDKEGGDFEDLLSDDEDVKKGEEQLKGDNYTSNKDEDQSETDDENDDDSDDDSDDEDDELKKAFESFDEEFGTGLVEINIEAEFDKKEDEE